jgi:hypothetical protein
MSRMAPRGYPCTVCGKVYTPDGGMCQKCRDRFEIDIAGEIAVTKKPEKYESDVTNYDLPELPAAAGTSPIVKVDAERQTLIQGLYKQSFHVLEVDGEFVVHKGGHPMQVKGATYDEAWDALIERRFSRGS